MCKNLLGCICGHLFSISDVYTSINYEQEVNWRYWFSHYTEVGKQAIIYTKFMQFVKKKYDNETLFKILKHVKYICWLKKKVH